MVNALMIMHHNSLCTPCIALVNCGRLLHMRVDHVEPKSEFQAEQVQWALEGPQTPSVVDANIAFGSRQVPMYLTTILEFCL
jgi:hypothetical protein